MKCDWCQKESDWVCKNTRDMTDAVISGDNKCFAALLARGRGESGEHYVRSNREHAAQLAARNKAGDNRSKSIKHFRVVCDEKE